MHLAQTVYDNSDSKADIFKYNVGNILEQANTLLRASEPYQAPRTLAYTVLPLTFSHYRNGKK